MANLWDNAACMELDRFLAAKGIRFTPPTLGTTLGSPPGGHGHTAGSNHYPERWGGPRGSTGQARDYGTFGSDCQAIADALEPYARQGIIIELIWTRRLPRVGTYYKRGSAYVPSLALARQHSDHVHAAIGVGKHLPSVGGPPQPVPQPAPVPHSEEEDVPYEGVFVTNAIDPTWWFYNGFNRRPVRKDENQLLVDLGLVKPGPDGKPTVKKVAQEWLGAIPLAPGY